MGFTICRAESIDVVARTTKYQRSALIFGLDFELCTSDKQILLDGRLWCDLGGVNDRSIVEKALCCIVFTRIWWVFLNLFWLRSHYGGETTQKGDESIFLGLWKNRGTLVFTGFHLDWEFSDTVFTEDIYDLGGQRLLRLV
jgi:hypothetical protein